MNASNRSDAPPELKQELDRKVMDTIRWLFSKAHDGSITDEQFSTGIDTLFMSVSGLVSPDFMPLIDAASDECANIKPCMRAVMMNWPEGIIALEWFAGSCDVRVSRTNMDDGETVACARTMETPAMARNLFQKTRDSLSAKGWRTL